MRKFLAVVAMLVAVGSAGKASAVPSAEYNPMTGAIFLKNPDAGTLAAIFIQSTSGDKFVTEAAKFAAVPGAQLDTGDLPLGFTYLDFPQLPAGQDRLKIGNVVVPGTPISDLSLGWYTSFTVPQVNGTIVEIVPEPATLALAGAGMIGMVAAARRRRA